MIPNTDKPMRLASDIEAIGFLDVVHKLEDVHCLASLDVDTEELYLFHDHPEFDGVEVYDKFDEKTYIIPERTGTLLEGLEFWSKAAQNGSKLVVHNTHTYDRVVVNRVCPENNIPLSAWDDTFIRSKMQYFDRPCPQGAKSAHGLKAYGIMMGINKPEVEDWSYIDAFKLHRCIEDVKIQRGCFLRLEKEREALESKGIDLSYAYKTVEVPYVISAINQELRGAKLDVEHVKDCVMDLDTKIKLLSDEIEPQLPPTVKGKGGKVSRKEVAELLGRNPAKTKDKFIQKKKEGEVITVVEKPFVKPTTNFHVTKKVNVYSASNIEHGFSPSFTKRPELIEWIRGVDPKCKPTVDWEIEKVVEETKFLNKNTCEYFSCKPEDTDYISGPFTRVEFTASRMTQHEKVKGFLIRLGLKTVEEWNLATDVYDNKIKVEEDTEVRWPPKAAPQFQLVKVVKKGQYLVSSPKLSEDDYEQLPEGLGKKIAEYNTFLHRRRFFSNPKDPENKGLLSMVREDGRIPCGVNSFNTATSRSSHRGWVNPAGEKSLYGEETRKSIVASEGKVLVGADQKSSQLSIAAFYAKNSEYYESIASGEEYDEDGKYIGKSAHCYSARNFGITSHEEWMRAVETQDSGLLKSIGLRRGFSKGASFGVIFGCSGGKLAGMLKVPEKEGNEKKDTFLKQMGLDNVKDWLAICKTTYSRGKNGFYIPLPFGYWVHCSQDHKAINYLIQGTEAIMEKMAELWFEKQLVKRGLQDKAYKVLSMHDEFLCESDEYCAQEVATLMAQSFTWAGKQLYNWFAKRPEMFPNIGGPEFVIDLASAAKVGKTYWDCH